MTHPQGGEGRPRKAKPPKKMSYDWGALKVEWLAGHETLNAFRIRKGMSAQNFYLHVKDWPAAKEEITQNAIKKVEGKLADFYGQYIEQTKRLLVNINNQFTAALQKTVIVDENTGDRTIAPMDAEKLASMSHSISANVRTLRLIEGKSTENKAVKLEGDLNMRLTGLIEAMEEDGQDTLGDVPASPPGAIEPRRKGAA